MHKVQHLSAYRQFQILGTINMHCGYAGLGKAQHSHVYLFGEVGTGSSPERQC